MYFPIHAVLLAMALLCIVKEGDLTNIPAGKCKHPIPSFPGMNLTEVEGEVFKYVYTPDVTVFKYMDSIAMLIKQVEDNIYSEIFHAHSIFGTTTKLHFNLEYLGDGVLKMKTKKGGGVTYMASIVAIEKDGTVGLLYVCSENAGSIKEDARYVIARKSVDPDNVEHPDILFKKTNEQYKFKGPFRKLPFQKSPTKASHNKHNWLFN